MQTVINICLAIFITVFIYQNNSQQDRIETLESNAQLNTDKAWDEIDKLKEELSDLETRFSYATDALDKWQVALENEMSQRLTNTENISILIANDEILEKKTNIMHENALISEKNEQALNERLNIINDWLSRNFGDNE